MTINNINNAKGLHIFDASKILNAELSFLYSSSEVTAIVNRVMEKLTGLSITERLINKNLILSNTQTQQLEKYCKELLQYRPLQYVLGEAWFAGMKFEVNENVLIPRPETEELVEWAKEEILASKSKFQTLIDIGTGSGCIAITIKKKLPLLDISAIDISEDALTIAKKNAIQLQQEVLFSQQDILEESSWNRFSSFDCIISNPPYIKQSESKEMDQHVLSYEPHLALFVPDNDALIFYRKIALFGKQHLSANGIIMMEINENLGKETEQLFSAYNYQTSLKKDINGKNRMLKAFL